MKKIGLIAGNRKFPLLFAESARKSGCEVVAVAIKGDTSARLKAVVDKIYWLGLSEIRKMVEIFKSEGVEGVVMAGQVSPRRLFSAEVLRSPQLKQILQDLKDKKAETLFAGVAAIIEEAGLKVLDSTVFIKEHLPGKGTLTKNQPDFTTWDDIYFGLDLAKAVAGLDIGQTIAVKHKAIVAVEALEGTDNLIRRAGKTARGGAVIVKVSKYNQDMRFDVPVIGLNTVKNLVRSKSRCLAFEAGKTLFLDRDESVRLAERHGISIVAI